MTHEKRNPGAGDAGARKTFDQLATAITPDLTSPLHVAQTHRLVRRYGLELHIAALVAELAFQGRPA
jgi:hypothetical protein